MMSVDSQTHSITPLPDAAWPDPDRSYITRGRREPPPLPGVEVFGAWNDWIAGAAAQAGVPRDYVAIPLLVAMAALVGNARRVSPWNGWVEPAVLWGGVVGDPSAGKSPGADPVLAAVRDVQAALAEGFDEKHRDWEARHTMAKAVKDVWRASVEDAAKKGGEPPELPYDAVLPDEPERPRVLVSDVTPERLATLLAANPKGLLATRDELTGWLQGFDRYAKSGERAFWIEAFGARPYTIDRVKAASVHIDRLSICVFGGLQPDRLANLLLKADDDGLTARFMWAWPDPLPPTRPQRTADGDFVRSAFANLVILKPVSTEGESEGAVPIDLPLSSEAADRFHRWRLDHDFQMRALAGMVLSGYGKMPGLLLRLGLVLELGEWAVAHESRIEPNQVSLEAVEKAIALIEGYLKPMARRVYGDAGVSDRERHAATLARWIVHSDAEIINKRLVRRTAGLPGLNDPRQVDDAFEELVDGGWLWPVEKTGGVGRRRKDYVVNPRTRKFM